MRTLSTVQKQYKNGDTTIQTKEASMEHLQSFQSTFKKAKDKKISQIIKKFGGNLFFYFRPNFNGTSKNFN